MGASTRSSRSVRFSHDTSHHSEADFSLWPGVYVHPGQFKHASDKASEEEAWQRCRTRLKRLKARLRKKTDRQSQSHGKRR